MFIWCKKSADKPREITKIDFRQETLQALLTEYSCLREEAQHDDTHQIQLVTIVFSTLAALIGVPAVFDTKIPRDLNLFLFFVVLPCLVMFMGLLWIDLIYRRTRFGCYTKILENKINALLRNNKEDELSIMEWEHWIQRLEDGTGFFNVTRFFRGYIVSGSWLISPILVMGAYVILDKGPFFMTIKGIWHMCRVYWPITAFMALIYLIYYGIFVIYLKKITEFPNKVP